MKKTVLGLFILFMAVLLIACKPEKDPLQEGRTTINFWGWGDRYEVEVFRNLVNTYNQTNTDEIYVNYVQNPPDSYESRMEQVLSGSRGPDIFYVGDGSLKKWVELDFLYDITSFVNASTIIDLEDIWSTAIQRYRYDVSTKTSTPESPLYALPKDIGPTVIYYNVDAFREVGVTVISKDLDDPTIADNEKQGYNIEEKIFNNRIPMTWEETEALSKLLTRSLNSASPTVYGYYTEWWFNYVWSVGGDVITLENDGNYRWSLGDTDPNTNANGDVLPSNREAFKHFIDLSTVHNTSPRPNTIATVGKQNYFTSERVAMMVDGRWSTVTFRRDADFEWDVAPLPVHENGVPAGHSGSMGFGIWKNTTRATEAFKFMEFMAGPVGQAEQAKMGFNIPNQISLANTDVFLQADQYPKNAQAFIDAAAYQREGDWAMLPDGAWIDIWAPTLNGAVLQGNTTIDAFFDEFRNRTNQVLRQYTDN